jgi:Zn-dependent protease
MMITALAGPVSNLVLAALCLLIMGLSAKFYPPLLLNEAARALLVFGVQINVLLAVFNALPIPPLDGSRVVDGLLPYRFRDAWQRFARFAPLVLLAVILMPSLVGFSVIDGPASFVSDTLQHSVFWLVGVI